MNRHDLERRLADLETAVAPGALRRCIRVLLDMPRPWPEGWRAQLPSSSVAVVNEAERHAKFIIEAERIDSLDPKAWDDLVA
jgi:hypothetical protein